MNGVVVWSRRQRRSPRVMEGSRRSRWRAGLPRARSGAGCRNWRRTSRPSGFGERAPDAREPSPEPAPAKAGDPTLLPDLEALVEPPAFAGAGWTRGDPGSPLRWPGKSVRRLAPARHAQAHEVSRTRVAHSLVAHLLDEAGYSLQGNRKTTEGDSHPDREAQFGSITTQVTTALAEQQPVISVDTKKKEPVGDFRNPGREDCPQGNPEEVRVHDVPIKELGRA